MLREEKERETSQKEMWRNPFMGTFHNGEGVIMRFENGNSVSIIFKRGSYSTCRRIGSFLALDRFNTKYCSDAEIQVSGSRGVRKRCLAHGPPDGVEGWQTPDQLAEIIACVAGVKIKPKKKRKKKR